MRGRHFLHAQQAVAELVQFVHLVAQQALSFACCFRSLATLVEFAGELRALAVALRGGGKQRRVHAELVEQSPLRVAGEQLAMFALAVDVDQRCSEGLQHGQRGRGAVHERPRAPFAGHPAHQAGGFFAAGEHVQPLQRIEAAGTIRHVELGAYLARVRARAHLRALDARAEHQSEGVEENGFASAGLAGDDREARAELDVEFPHQGEVANVERSEHGASGLRREGNGKV